MRRILAWLFLACVTAQAYDFGYIENGERLVTRNADPFSRLEREWRDAELPVQWERSGDGFSVFVEHGGERWYCADGTMVATDLPKIISKLDLLLVLHEMGKMPQFFAWLDASGLKPFWDAAQEMATDHPLFNQALASVAAALELSDEQVAEIIERIAR